MNRAVPVALLVAAVMFVTASRAAACSCLAPDPPCQAFWKADAVFEARVVSVERAPHDKSLGDRVLQIPEKLVTLEVGQTWKGAASKRYIVFALEILDVHGCAETDYGVTVPERVHGGPLRR